jgi:hypothetical protein
MFSTIFCTVPAFIRVDPVTTSGPVCSTIASSAASAKGEPPYSTATVRTSASGSFDRRDGKWSAPAGSNADHHVVSRRPFLANFARAEFERIFVGFYRQSQRFCAARDHKLDHFRRSIKRRSALSRVQGRDTPAGSGADVNETAALSQRVGNPIDGLRNLGQRTFNHCCNFCVFRVDNSGDLKRRLCVEISRNEVLAVR